MPSSGHLFPASFLAGAREGFVTFLPLSVGLVPWALVMGMAMTSAGFTPLQAMGMNIIVFAGTAQLGTLPLIAGEAPLWLIVATALALNLRFVIFSAAIAPGFRGIGTPGRWLAGHLLTDGVFATCLDRMLHTDDPHWRLGYYLAPAVWSWALWQLFALLGIHAAGFIPRQWSLEFMATIALIVLLVPMARVRPMLVAAVVGGASATLLRDMPLRLGIVVAICAGIAAGFAAEHWEHKGRQP
ncbi:AzlC family ABC transporter permease [Dechloromonas sp. H13]|uniref:AzlC family ABC transporter permease n=1 Tax=Dechloromonas sp. H13 TaxID=2570193 RepID=UPI001291E0C5|nr:AzlC family ABC transporter permease [Dechloromonas sp. H13]